MVFSFCSFFCFCCFFSRSCSLIQTTVITTASTNAVIATSTYPPPLHATGSRRTFLRHPSAGSAPSLKLPQGTKTAEHTEQTGDRLYAAPFGGDIHTFAFLPAQHAFLYRTYLPTSSKAQLKKAFHLYRYKNSEKLSPQNRIFSKNLGAAQKQLPKKKNSVVSRYETAGDKFSHCQNQNGQEISDILCRAAVGDQQVIDCMNGNCRPQQAAGSGNF